METIHGKQTSKWSSIKGAKSIIRNWNQNNNQDNGEVSFEYEEMNRSNGETKFLNRWRRFIIWLSKSRWSGIPFACVYAFILFLYVTFMIMSEPENLNIGPRKQFNFSQNCKSKTNNNTLNTTEATTPPNFVKPDENSKYVYGIIVGLSIFLLLFVISIFSKHSRCIMVLVLPGIITGRGRAILMTATVAILVEGPINSVNFNIDQVVESQTCMYESMKSASCQYVDAMQNVLEQTSKIIKEQRDEFTRELRQIEEKVQQATGKARQELEEQQRKLKEKADAFNRKLDKARERKS